MAGRLVLVFDDGSEADYSLVRPLLREYDARACFAVTPGRIGNEGCVNADQLRALADAGHEIAAHGLEHRYLQCHALAADADVGDDRIAVDGHVFPDDSGGVRVGDAYELTDGTRRETHVVAETLPGDEHSVVAFEDELGAPFDRADTVFRVTEPVLLEEVVGVRDALGELGFDAGTFVFPYDAADARAWTLARDAYATLPNAAVRSLPNPRDATATNLRRYYLETTHLTRLEIDEYLDLVAETDALGILAGHSTRETITTERLRYALDAATTRDVDVTTFRDLHGNGWF